MKMTNADGTNNREVGCLQITVAAIDNAIYCTTTLSYALFELDFFASPFYRIGKIYNHLNGSFYLNSSSI